MTTARPKSGWCATAPSVDVAGAAVNALRFDDPGWPSREELAFHAARLARQPNDPQGDLLECAR